jgi:signal transduction histidine kinase
MLGQLLSNLIENAFQHGVGESQDNLDITLRVTHDETGVHLSVEDNGKGVPQEDRHLVFNKFFRGQAGLQPNDNNHGNGLGLALVKAIADLHAAEVQLVALTPGVKFLLTFPRTRSTGL